ncbi:MAG: YbhN family protein [Anaerolineae bacterium]
MKRNPRPLMLITRVLPFILTLVILILLLTQISVRDVVGLLANLSLGWVALGFACYLITNICRALRLRVLLPERTFRFRSLLAIVLAQSMFNNTLPARTGELSFVYLLNRHERVPFDQATVALIVARLSDYLAVAALFIAAALIALPTLPGYAVTVIWAVLAVMLLTVALLLAAVWLGKRSLSLAGRVLGRRQISRWRPVAFGLEKMEQVIRAFEAVHSLRLHLKVFLWSLVIWFGTFAWFYAFLRSIDLQPTPTKLVVGSTFAVLSKAVPFISVGGLGAHEAGWTVGFTLVGFEPTLAIASGFAVNILTLLASLVFGPWGLWLLRSRGRAEAGDGTEAEIKLEAEGSEAQPNVWLQS